MTNVPSPDVSVFIKLLDRGFNLSVPPDQEKFYRDGYEAFLHKVNHYKEGKTYDDIEAIALASIDCLVAFQKSQEVMKELIDAFQSRVGRLDETVTSAIEG